MATVNPWVKFASLMPKPVRRIGQVVSTDPALGRAVIRLRNGDQLLVLGSAEVDAWVWVEDSRITGPAADLPYYEMIVS